LFKSRYTNVRIIIIIIILNFIVREPSGASRKLDGAERFGERELQKNDGAERGAGGHGAGTDRGVGVTESGA